MKISKISIIIVLLLILSPNSALYIMGQPLQQQGATLPPEARTYQLYIMLEVHDVNSNDQPIHWQETIDEVKAMMTDTLFVPAGYHHITLTWYESKEPFTQEYLAKIEKALTRANEILKIVYPDGVQNLSFIDGAMLLGKRKDALVFKVTKSADLQKIQQIILKFLAFENAVGFKFNTFEQATPLHFTLGKIQPAKRGREFKDAAETLNAPAGARASQGEYFSADRFKATYSSTSKGGYQELGTYDFMQHD